VLASGFVAVKTRLAEIGKAADLTGNKNPVDPLGLVDQIAKRPDLKIYVLTDPDDVVISARSQAAYVRRLSAAGLQVRQIFMSASDVSRHQLVRETRLIAAACAKGVAADTIIAMYQNKVPAIAPDADEPPLHKSDVLSAGLTLSEDQCKKLETAVWTRVDGRGSCVRYWISTAGGNKAEALIYLQGDIGGRDAERSKLTPYQAAGRSSDMQRDAQAWSRSVAGPYIEIGRPGAFGSSGNHLRDRRTGWEIGVLMQALDALKQRHHFARLHLIGQSGGGHNVAALVQKRDDIGCAVMASGSASVRAVERDRGNNSGNLKPGTYDPIDFVDKMRHQPGRRLIVLSDPDDKIVSFRSQREFVERIKGKGVPILHISAAASDENFHGLASEGRRVVTDCIAGIDDAALIAKYQNKPGPTQVHSAVRRAR
jgi:hypothetical protein